jgi:pimeloyl-[acyl-carrier protein] synthase
LNTNASDSPSQKNGVESRTAKASLLFNPFDPRVNSNPYPHYERLRTQDPVHWSKLGVWFVGRYEDARAILKDRRFRVREISDIFAGTSAALDEANKGGEGKPALAGLAAATSNWLIFQEAANHRRLKTVYTSSLNRSLLDSLRPIVRDAARSLIERQLPRGEMDVMRDFARELPFQIIAPLIGLPLEMYPKMQKWVRLLTRFVVSFSSLEDLELMDAASAEFMAYLRKLIAERRSTLKGDLLANLIMDRADQNQRLVEQELLSVCIFIIVAGLEAVENCLGNSTLALITHPKEYHQFRDNAGSLPNAIDELIRFDAPLQLVMRKALEDVEIGGKMIHAGDYVYVAIGSANRDPARFDKPNELILDRQQNHHLAFGDGHHLCVGVQLTRIEVHEALQVMAEMLPSMRAATERFSWGHSLLAHGLTSLPVRFG